MNTSAKSQLRPNALVIVRLAPGQAWPTGHARLVTRISAEGVTPQLWHVRIGANPDVCLREVHEENLVAPSHRTESGLAVPLVNLNGTSKQSLIDELDEARDAIRKATDALDNITIHGRDFVMQDHTEYKLAREQMASRIGKLDTVYAELTDILKAIYNQ